MRSHPLHFTAGLLSVAAAAWLLNTGTARADTLDRYTVQVLMRNGEKAGDLSIAKGAILAVGQMNNKGQIVFLTVLEGGQLALVQRSEDRYVVIAAQGGPSPDGKTWNKSMGFSAPVAMNQAGQVVFDPGLPPNGDPYGSYFWDPALGQVTPVATKGQPVTDSLTLQDVGTGSTLNNRGEIAFTGWVKNAKKQIQPGVFLRRTDGKIEPVALPDQPLPGRGTYVVNAYEGRINDAGAITFNAVGKSGPPSNSYVWEQGTITLLAEVGTEVPGVGKLGQSGVFCGNNKNQTIFLNGTVKGKQALFFWIAGVLAPVALPDQAMPGGGKFSSWSGAGWGYPNALGQYPIVAQITENGKTLFAAYLVEPDGKLTLVLKSGMTTELGQAVVGIDGLYGISVNDLGEVALPVKFDKGPTSLVVLKPVKADSGG